MAEPKNAAEAALRYFRGTQRSLPCSSVVAAAFKGVEDPLVEATRKYGGGRHETNECGSLVVAKQLRPDLEELLNEEFEKNASSCKCKQIRSRNQLTCAGCVTLACTILEQNGEVFVK